MAVSPARPRKTIDDLRTLPEDVRAELIDGELLVTPAPLRPHQEASAWLTVVLATYAREAGGHAFAAPFDVHLPSGDVVQPDLLWIRPERASILKDCVHGAPDLVVEILSPGNPERDLFVKRGLYARNAVPEYWLVDPETESIQVLVLDRDAYRPAGWFPKGARLVSPSLAGLTFPVSDVFPSSPPPPPPPAAR